MPNERTIKANWLGIRVGHVIMHERFRNGCQPADAQPTDRVIVGLMRMGDIADGFNGCFDASRGSAPFEVTSIDSLDECDSADQLEGLRMQYLHGAKVVSAVRLNAFDLSRPAMGERIVFVIAAEGSEDAEDNVPVVEYVQRLRKELPVPA